MASSYSADYRDSTVYVQPEIEGYLDKKPSGVFRTKTPRRWCWVQGSIFYQQKSNPGSAPDEIEILDISGAQCVRNVSADPTGTQFEIFLKKTHVFICGSREECNRWLKALQTAMTIGHSTASGASFYTDLLEEEAGTYSNIDESLSSNKQPSTSRNDSSSPCQGNTNDNAPNLCNEYIVPQDTVYNGEMGGASCEENIYSDVQDVESCVQAMSVQDSSSSSSDRPNPPPRPSPKDDVNAVYVDGCSCKGLPPQSASKDDPKAVYVDGCSARPKQRLYTKNQQEEKVQSQPSIMTPTVAVNDPDETALKTSEIADQEDPVNYLFKALDDRMSPVSDLKHILTKDDAKPLKELKAFLRNNEIHCRVSTNRLSQSEDPITACRSYLTSLDSMM